MALVQTERKKVRTPEGMAKAALASIANKDFAENGLPQTALVSIKWGDKVIEALANVTVNLKNGAINLYYASGKPMPIQFGKVHTLARLSGNFATGQSVADHKPIVLKYVKDFDFSDAMPGDVAKEPTDEEYSAGEATS